MPTTWDNCDFMAGAGMKTISGAGAQDDAFAAFSHALRPAKERALESRRKKARSFRPNRWSIRSKKPRSFAILEAISRFEKIIIPARNAGSIDSDDVQRAKSILAELSDAAGAASIKRVSRLLDSVRDVIESLGLEVALAEAEASVRQGNVDSALAIVFDRLDNAFVSGAFCHVDQWLAGMAIDDVSSDVLIGILAASLPAKRELRQRHDFVARVVESLERRGLSEDGLLTGLD